MKERNQLKLKININISKKERKKNIFGAERKIKKKQLPHEEGL